MIIVDDKDLPWRERMTVGDLIRDLDDKYPYTAVRIGDQYVSRPNFETVLVPDNVKIFLIPLISGG